jgi:hypothetical protein
MFCKQVMMRSDERLFASKVSGFHRITEIDAKLGGGIELGKASRC